MSGIWRRTDEERVSVVKPVIDHVHITVKDLERAEAFYDALLPLLGFDLSLKERDCVPEQDYRIVEYHSGGFSLGIVNPRREYERDNVSRRRPGAMHHLAFRVERREDVDAIYAQVSAIPATIVRAPMLYPEYCEEYYAFFFKDTEEIEYEVVYIDRQRYFPE